MLMLEPKVVSSVERWLATKFSEYGEVESVRIPRLKCNWDGGMGYVTFRRPEEAYQALRRLDGTPSCVAGCNMYIDFAAEKPLHGGTML